MPIYNREEKYLNLLKQKDYSVKELSEKLFISEPTVRRDIIFLKEKNLVTCKRGIVSFNVKSADQRIPLFIRETEFNEAKKIIAIKAAKEIKDGDVIMLDASTTAFYLLSHIATFKKVLVITNGAKTALEATAMGIKTICTGGEMTPESFSYVGTDAEQTLSRYNADIAFFSCRGVSNEGIITDNSILENSMRKIMISNSKRKYLLCDQSKFDKIHLNTLCHKRDLDGIISN